MVPPKTVLYITGGGTEAIGMLLRNGGASSYIEEIRVPYSKESIRQILSYEPPKYSCRSVARQLAVHAFYRAKELVRNDNIQVCGIGSTAKLKVANERAGREHNYHVAMHDDKGTMLISTKLRKGTRQQQEQANAESIIMLVAPNTLSCHGGSHAEIYEEIQYRGEQAKVGLHKNDLSYFYNSTQVPYPGPGINILSGSFNPLHEGHLNMGRAAYQVTGKPVYYELSIINTSKPSLDHIEINKRIEQFKPYDGEPWFGGLIVDSIPLFVDKAKMFSNSTFVVGADTITRVLGFSYEGYHDDKHRQVALSFLREYNAKFLVCERKNYGSLESNIFDSMRDRVQQIPSTLYKDDGLTSSQLRKGDRYEWAD